MARMLGLRQPLFAVAARFNGMRMRDSAADSSSKPMISSSMAIVLRIPTNDLPFQGEGGSRPLVAALR